MYNSMLTSTSLLLSLLYANECKIQSTDFLYDPEINVIVYLRSTPEYCMRRIHERGRSEESNVSEALLDKLHTLHEKWIEAMSISSK
ncbi:deoxycytidine kinase-like isoform X2, partial [Leptotrombidium deliense]